MSSWPSDALQTTRPRSAIQFTALAVTLVALFHFCSRTDIWALLSHPDSRHNSGVSNETREFRWDELSAKPYLDYSGCYNGFQCAKLELSMDYWNDTTDANISLAVIRLPAVVPITDPQYGGAVLLNPGGPGGSGIYFILASGLHVRETIDSADGKYYDLISFDPRGVGETKPNVECMKNLELDHSWQVRVKEEVRSDFDLAVDMSLMRKFEMSDSQLSLLIPSVGSIRVFRCRLWPVMVHVHCTRAKLCPSFAGRWA